MPPPPAIRPAAFSRDLTRNTRRLMEILSLQVDAFEELHADLEFDLERVKALQVLVRSLTAMDDLIKRNGAEDDTDGYSHGDIVEFRQQLERQLEALVERGKTEEVGQPA